MRNLFLKLLTLLFVIPFIGCEESGSKQIILQEPQVPQAPIEVPAPKIPNNPNFIDLELLGDSILLDLNTLSDVERQNTRYLIACNEFNRGNTEMEGYFNAANKFINSISTESTLESVTAVGPVDCAFRIDLRDYGLTFTEWEKIASYLLLQFIDDSIRGQQIRFLTQTNYPYVYASDIAVTTLNADALTQNGLYYELIEQPFLLADFFASLGVDPQREFDDEEAVLSAFSQSQIALGKTRSVQVLEADEFFVVTTYDSALSGQDDHFQNPFPIEAAQAQGVLRSDKVFNFNAQEHIYFLPNGMLGFRLNGSDANGGAAELVAPNDVVINTDASARRLDPTIFIGSCYACHSGAKPMLEFRDQLASHIRFNSNFDALEKELGTVFFNETVMEGRLRQVDQEAKNALGKLNIREDRDGIHDKLIYPLRAEQNADQVCGYLLLETNDCLRRLAGTQISSQVFGNLLNGNTVSLAVLVNNFEQLVIDLGAYRDDDLQ